MVASLVVVLVGEALGLRLAQHNPGEARGLSLAQDNTTAALGVRLAQRAPGKSPALSLAQRGTPLPERVNRSYAQRTDCGNFSDGKHGVWSDDFAFIDVP